MYCFYRVLFVGHQFINSRCVLSQRLVGLSTWSHGHLHCWHVSRWCWCCQSGDHTETVMNGGYIYLKQDWAPNTKCLFLCESPGSNKCKFGIQSVHCHNMCLSWRLNTSPFLPVFSFPQHNSWHRKEWSVMLFGLLSELLGKRHSLEMILKNGLSAWFH